MVSWAGRDNVTHSIEKGLHLRLEWLHYGGGPANLQLLWRPGTPSAGGGGSALTDAAPQPFLPVPSSALSPDVRPAELWRQDLQRGLSQGWNTWMRDNAMRHVHLPSGFGFEVQLWDIPTAAGSSAPPLLANPLPKQVDVKGLVDKCVSAQQRDSFSDFGCVSRC